MVPLKGDLHVVDIEDMRPSEQVDAAVDGSIRARAMASLYIAGGVIGAVSLVLPHVDGANDAALWSNVALAFIGGLLLLGFGPRLPRGAFHVGVAVGAVLVTRAVLASGESVSFYSVWYLWIGLYAFYFFNRVAAVLHVALAAALYGITLVAHTPPSALARWLTTIATLFIAGLFIDTLVRRSRMQAKLAAESAQLVVTVADVAHELARVPDGDAARQALCAAAARLAQADSVALWEPAAKGSALDLTASAGPRPPQRSLPFVSAPGGAVRAFTAGETVTETPEKG